MKSFDNWYMLIFPFILLLFSSLMDLKQCFVVVLRIRRSSHEFTIYLPQCIDKVVKIINRIFCSVAVSYFSF